MFNLDVLTFQEFAVRETVTLSKIQEFVLNFLRGREDAVIFGAQAVNAYVAEPRMTQDIDLLSTHARELAEELRFQLSETFNIAVRVREVAGGKGFRVYQVQKQGNRHLIDVRAVGQLPQSSVIEEVNVLAPAELIASKVVSFHARKGKPKSGTDWRDLAMLLLQFPELKNEPSAVAESLKNLNAGENIMQVWRELAAAEISLEDEDEDLSF